MGKKIKIYQTEQFTTYVVRDSITIDLDDYPELKEMDNNEIMDYLISNSSEMKPQNDKYYISLSDELSQMDVLNDKIYDEDYSYIVEDLKK
jgi:hypothetical protein